MVANRVAFGIRSRLTFNCSCLASRRVAVANLMESTATRRFSFGATCFGVTGARSVLSSCVQVNQKQGHYQPRLRSGEMSAIFLDPPFHKTNNGFCFAYLSCRIHRFCKAENANKTFKANLNAYLSCDNLSQDF